MATLTLFPDNVLTPVDPDQTLLSAIKTSGVPIFSACGGNARCSTCRVWVLGGSENCSERTDAEKQIANRLCLQKDIRLACQLKIAGDITVRRLILDEADLDVANLLGERAQTHVGEAKNICVLFSDVVNFTGISEKMTPYDVLFMLNKYHAAMENIITAHHGYIDNIIGDGLMVLFGVNDEELFLHHAVKAGLEMLEAVDIFGERFRQNYGIDFDIRVGIHYGEVVIGAVHSGKRRRLTAIGDVVNIASRIEAANKEAGTRLLISENMQKIIADQIIVEDHIRLRPRGSTERMSLFSVSGLTPATEALLQKQMDCQLMEAKVAVIKDKTYYWCDCGLSLNQPFCDEQQCVAKQRPFKWTATETAEVSFCVCKKTATPPLCDGSHNKFRMVSPPPKQ